ncbi:MAG TPA: hypothetical protein VFG09_11790 [Thermodesulfovibrionales bacterium]|jgi:hypothetical protein|nr:hypothetical protein [Thermodesulfovibrionales bacterium]
MNLSVAKNRQAGMDRSPADAMGFRQRGTSMTSRKVIPHIEDTTAVVNNERNRDTGLHTKPAFPNMIGLYYGKVKNDTEKNGEMSMNSSPALYLSASVAVSAVER